MTLTTPTFGGASELVLPTLTATPPAERPALVDRHGAVIPATTWGADELYADFGATPPAEGDVPPEPDAVEDKPGPDIVEGESEPETPALPDDPGVTALLESDPLPVTAETTPEPQLVAPPTHVVDIDDPLDEVASSGKKLKFKVFSLIDPDRRWVMIVAIVLMTSVLAANLVTSFTNVYAMAAWIGIPVEVQWLPVVILDVAIVGLSWGLMVFKSRGKPVGRTRIYIGVVTGFSVVANFMHTYDHWNGDLTSPQAITGISFSSSIPIMSLVITEELIRLVFKLRDRREKAEKADWAEKFELPEKLNRRARRALKKQEVLV